MSAVARTWPYRRAVPARVAAGPWFLRMGGEATPVGESVDDWDPMTDLHLVRRLRVDVDGIWSDCGLEPGTPLRVAACWSANGTTLRGVGSRTPLSTGGARVEVPLGLQLSGRELGGTLELGATITLGVSATRRVLTAFRLGTVLWEDTATVRIEGGASRFPIEDIPFSSAGFQYPNNAAWRLDWDKSDLELPVLGSVRLFVNREHPAVRQLLDSPDRPEARALSGFMMFDVTRALLRGALAGDELLERHVPWPPDSVGRVIERIFKAHLRDMPPANLRQLMHDDPDRFDALLQDRLGLLRQQT